MYFENAARAELKTKRDHFQDDPSIREQLAALAALSEHNQRNGVFPFSVFG